MKRKLIITLLALNVSLVSLSSCGKADDIEPVMSSEIETDGQQEVEEEEAVAEEENIVAEVEDIREKEPEQEVEEENTVDEVENIVSDEPEQEAEEVKQEEKEGNSIVEEGQLGNGAGESITEDESTYFAEAEALWAEHSAELAVNWETFREEYAYERGTGLSKEEVFNNLYEMFKIVVEQSAEQTAPQDNSTPPPLTPEQIALLEQYGGVHYLGEPNASFDPNAPIDSSGLENVTAE